MMTCFDCSGSGWVDAETGDACNADDPMAIPCETCQGTGDVDPDAD